MQTVPASLRHEESSYGESDMRMVLWTIEACTPVCVHIQVPTPFHFYEYNFLNLHLTKQTTSSKIPPIPYLPFYLIKMYMIYNTLNPTVISVRKPLVPLASRKKAGTLLVSHLLFPDPPPLADRERRASSSQRAPDIEQISSPG